MIASSAVSSGKPAPMWQHSFAALLDGSIVFSSLYYAANHWGAELPNGGRGWQDWNAVAALCLTAAYWIVPEWLFGCTIGKFILGLPVVSASSKRITLSQSLKRNLLRPIDFIFFYLIGFVVAMLNPHRQRLGDQWGNTIVVARSRTESVDTAQNLPARAD